jgi:hypothetical protein
MIFTIAENPDAAAVNLSFPTVALQQPHWKVVDILGPEHDRTALRISTVRLSALSRGNSDAANNAVAREGNTETTLEAAHGTTISFCSKNVISGGSHGSPFLTCLF